MPENKHTITDLYQMQSLPLDAKIKMTQQRIREWVNEWGIDGVHVSFSGGKDSTVLLNLARELYPDIKAVFVDTGLEYPEIREFVKTFDNVEWLKPKMTFRQVIEKYGYPFISKEVSGNVYGAKIFLQSLKDDVHLNGQALLDYADKMPIDQGKYKYRYAYDKLRGNGEFGYKRNDENSSREKSKYCCDKYKFFLEDGAPPISNYCCYVMKKSPIFSYQNKTGRKPIMGDVANESMLRTQSWLKNGCNIFNSKKPKSNPMSFWTDQDILLYIKENNIPMCSIYGEIVEDCEIDSTNKTMSFSNYVPLSDSESKNLKTTMRDRTGCMFCGFGCHLEKSPNRFEMMKETHPKQYEYIMKPWDDGGLGYKEAIDWINEHGNINIKY